MKVSELPESQLLGVAGDVKTLAWLLAEATGLSGFSMVFFQLIHGAECSVRMVSGRSLPESVPLPAPVSLGNLAREFLSDKFASEARYSPSCAADPTWVKGWEVRSAKLRDQPVAILRATWVQWIGAVVVKDNRTECQHKNVELDPFHEDLRAMVGIARGKCKDCGAEVAKREDGGSYGPTSALEPGFGR